MSLDKAIKHNKEHRKPYRNEKAVDPSCRNHGDDDWAYHNRTYQCHKAEQQALSKINDWLYKKS